MLLPSICFCSWGGAAASMEGVSGSCPWTCTAGWVWKRSWERDNSQTTGLDRNWTTRLVLCSYLLEGDRLHHLRVGVTHTRGIFVRWHIAGARDPHWGTRSHSLGWGWMGQNKQLGPLITSLKYLVSLGVKEWMIWWWHWRTHLGDPGSCC